MLDVTEVTNGQFAEFADATGYETDAEKFGWSFVFEGLLRLAEIMLTLVDLVSARARVCGTLLVT